MTYIHTLLSIILDVGRCILLSIVKPLFWRLHANVSFIGSTCSIKFWFLLTLNATEYAIKHEDDLVPRPS